MAAGFSAGVRVFANFLLIQKGKRVSSCDSTKSPMANIRPGPRYD